MPPNTEILIHDPYFGSVTIKHAGYIVSVTDNEYWGDTSALITKGWERLESLILSDQSGEH